MACRREIAGFALAVLMTASLAGGAAFAAAGDSPSSSSAAQGAPPAPVIVMVDMQQLVYGSMAGKGVQAELTQERQTFSKQVSEEEDQLRKSGDDIQRQEGIIPPEAAEKRDREIQQKLDELDRSVKDRQQAWQRSFNAAMGKVEDEALSVVAKIAAEHGANLVIDKRAVVINKGSFDITEEAVARLDKDLPSVPLEPPGPGTENSPPPDGPAGTIEVPLLTPRQGH